jgi:hypothetical protein
LRDHPMLIGALTPYSWQCPLVLQSQILEIFMNLGKYCSVFVESI